MGGGDWKMNLARGYYSLPIEPQCPFWIKRDGSIISFHFLSLMPLPFFFFPFFSFSILVNSFSLSLVFFFLPSSSPSLSRRFFFS